jgi:hypothetical protein
MPAFLEDLIQALVAQARGGRLLRGSTDLVKWGN